MAVERPIAPTAPGSEPPQGSPIAADSIAPSELVIKPNDVLSTTSTTTTIADDPVAGIGSFSRTRRRLLQLGGLLFGTAAVAGTGALILGRAFEPGGPEAGIFDNGATTGVIGEANTSALPLSEVKTQFPQQLAETGNNLGLLFPVQLPDGGKIEYKRSLSERLPTKDIREYAKAKDIRDEIKLTLPKGSRIIVPANGHVLVAKGRTDLKQDPTRAYYARIISHNSQTDTTYVIFITTSTITDTPGFQPLMPMQENVPSNWVDINWKNLPIAPQGTPILHVDTDREQVLLNVKAYKGEEIGPNAEVVKKTLSLLNPNFLVTPADKKLVVVKN